MNCAIQVIFGPKFEVFQIQSRMCYTLNGLIRYSVSLILN